MKRGTRIISGVLRWRWRRRRARPRRFITGDREAGKGGVVVNLRFADCGFWIGEGQTKREESWAGAIMIKITITIKKTARDAGATVGGLPLPNCA